MQKIATSLSIPLNTANLVHRLTISGGAQRTYKGELRDNLIQDQKINGEISILLNTK